jgi:hypothetical protein
MLLLLLFHREALSGINRKAPTLTRSMGDGSRGAFRFPSLTIYYRYFGKH